MGWFYFLFYAYLIHDVHWFKQNITGITPFGDAYTTVSMD